MGNIMVAPEIDIDDLKKILLENIDPDELVDALELSTEEILDRFTDKLSERSYKFIDYLDKER